MNHLFRRPFPTLALGWLLLAPGLDAQLASKPDDPYFAKFEPKAAPAPRGLLLEPGDRLAICGDSITEQKMYSRIIETYLTACVPDLKVTVRQYGWSGETAEGFLRRMTNDCLRFKPTIATTCYGMNDHRYQPYDDAVARWYLENQTAIVRAFKSAGARVVIGSPGCVGKMPGWVKEAKGTVEDLNLNLCAFRNHGLDLAAQEGVHFADVFWPMYVAGFEGRKRYGDDYAIAGKDGVHPDWAGQLVMAYAFLKALGLDGEIGSVTVDFASGQATASEGHAVRGMAGGEVTLESRRYPFCATGDSAKDNSIRSGMTLVPFNAELNRFRLVVKNAPGATCKVTWGPTSRSYSAAQLEAGVNLAEDFVENPFTGPFRKIEEAVAVKQAYETRQIKALFHGEEGRMNRELTASFTEQIRQPLAEAVAGALVPVTHRLKIEAE